MAYNTDFIGFTYNGKHSINNFNVYRTSDGDRYNDNLIPPMTDKSVDIPGGNGQYYFNTHHKNREFQIQIAFDELTEEKYREMRQWLDGKGVHELVFDEVPYKVYSAKVTGTPQLKTICFDKDGQRIYKGEGTIQFTCYYPYAHTPKIIISNTFPEINSKIAVACGLVVYKNESLYMRDAGKMSLDITNLITNESTTFTLNEVEEKKFDYPIIINTVKPITYTYPSILGINDRDYRYTDANCYEEIFTGERLGRNINDYSIKQFPNKAEWALAANLSHKTDGENYGDLTAPFMVIKTGEVSAGSVFEVGNNKITITNDTTNLEWDSKTGIVTGLVSGKRVPIPYTGKSYGTLQVGNNTVSINGGTIKYNYWYY